MINQVANLEKNSGNSTEFNRAYEAIEEMAIQMANNASATNSKATTGMSWGDEFKNLSELLNKQILDLNQTVVQNESYISTIKSSAGKLATSVENQKKLDLPANDDNDNSDSPPDETAPNST